MHPSIFRKNQKIALAKAIVLLRQRKNYKREFFAELLGLSVPSIDKLEQGVTCFRFTDVEAICRALKVELNELSLLYMKELEKLSTPPPRNRQIALGDLR